MSISFLNPHTKSAFHKMKYLFPIQNSCSRVCCSYIYTFPCVKSKWPWLRFRTSEITQLGKMRKLLIINADDFGYSVSRNIGMVECFTKGVISGVTLMVNGVADEDAAKRAKESNVPTGIYIRRTICVKNYGICFLDTWSLWCGWGCGFWVKGVCLW